MSFMKTARELASEGKHGEAVRVVEQAATAGDGEALLTLAYWRLFGVHGQADHELAHQLLSKAAAAGNFEAARTRAYLIGNGTGCASDPQRARASLEDLAGEDPVSKRQLDFLKGMISPDRLPKLDIEVLNAAPSIYLIRKLLNPPECQYLAALAEPALQPSWVIDPRSGRPIPHPFRTSAGMNFGPTQEDLVVQAINQRIALATGTGAGCGEPLHILKYLPGQEYRPHLDALAGVINQREWTVLIYLNSGYSGGETHFPELDLAVRGKEGDALVFRNCDDEGQADLRTRHAGLPVTAGVKWLATRWIRAAPFDPWAERGAAHS